MALRDGQGGCLWPGGQGQSDEGTVEWKWPRKTAGHWGGGWVLVEEASCPPRGSGARPTSLSPSGTEKVSGSFRRNPSSSPGVHRAKSSQNYGSSGYRGLGLQCWLFSLCSLGVMFRIPEGGATRAAVWTLPESHRLSVAGSVPGLLCEQRLRKMEKEGLQRIQLLAAFTSRRSWRPVLPAWPQGRGALGS